MEFPCIALLQPTSSLQAESIFPKLPFFFFLFFPPLQTYGSERTENGQCQEQIVAFLGASVQLPRAAPARRQHPVMRLGGLRGPSGAEGSLRQGQGAAGLRPFRLLPPSPPEAPYGVVSRRRLYFSVSSPRGGGREGGAPGRAGPGRSALPGITGPRRGTLALYNGRATRQRPGAAERTGHSVPLVGRSGAARRGEETAGRSYPPSPPASGPPRGAPPRAPPPSVGARCGHHAAAGVAPSGRHRGGPATAPCPRRGSAAGPRETKAVSACFVSGWRRRSLEGKLSPALRRATTPRGSPACHPVTVPAGRGRTKPPYPGPAEPRPTSHNTGTSAGSVPVAGGGQPQPRGAAGPGRVAPRAPCGRSR